MTNTGDTLKPARLLDFHYGLKIHINPDRDAGAEAYYVERGNYTPY